MDSSDGRATWRLILISVCCAFAGPFQAIGLTIVNNTQSVVEAWLNDTMSAQNGSVPAPSMIAALFGFLVSCNSLGSAVGALFVYPIADKFGRKPALITASICDICGGLMCLFPLGFSSVLPVILGRLLIGFGVGLANGAGVVYLVEIPPTRIRGTFVTLLGVFSGLSSLGLLSGLLSNHILKEYWPIFYCIPAIPGITLILALSVCPDSPRYLFMKEGRSAKVERVS